MRSSDMLPPLGFLDKGARAAHVYTGQAFRASRSGILDILGSGSEMLLGGQIGVVRGEFV